MSVSVTIVPDDLRGRVPDLTDPPFTDDQLNLYITDACCLLEQLEGKGLTDACLTIIGIYLSLHFLASDPKAQTLLMPIKKDKRDKSELEYSISTKTLESSLRSSYWGQKAILLDTTGCLNEIDQTKNTFTFASV